MALYTLKDICKLAQENHFAVPAFNCYNFETITWAAEAADEAGAPVILMIYPGFEEMMPLEYFVETARHAASRASVPVAVHLDHCYDFDHILLAAHLGCTGVMVDASAKSFEENVAISAEVTKAVHAIGGTVEAELGKVGSADKADDFINTDAYTSPEEAARFVELTGVDALAVAIGSAHGAYITEPKLDIRRLFEIREATDVPLVLHGGSGIPENQIQEAVKHGITKVNIATEYFAQNYSIACDLIRADGENKLNGYSLALEMRAPVKEFVKSRIKMLHP